MSKVNKVLLAAVKLAKKAHAGQTDRAGVDYYNGHLFTVMSKANLHSPYAGAVGVLHDYLEDTDGTVDDLVAADMPPAVVHAVEALTKVDGENYNDYLARVKYNDLARVVKLADLAHNMDLTRLDVVLDSDVERVTKYALAVKYLKS